MRALLSQNPFPPVAAALPRGANLLADIEWPEHSPFDFPEAEAQLFAREDESDDARFYDEPRFVHHIDDGAIAALTAHYERSLPSPGSRHLDLCSSWVSFLPPSPRYAPSQGIVGLGMNAAELDANPRLTTRVVRDLNAPPSPEDSPSEPARLLPFDDGSFDAVTNVVSVDYMKRPLALFRDMSRVLRPGGIAIMSFSNRMFWTKAVRVWTQASEWQRVLVCAAYFRYCDAPQYPYEQLEAFHYQAEPGGGDRHDPLYVVQARKAEQPFSSM